MNARWVLDTFWPELPQVDHTIVARWWPWDYYCVSTKQVKQDTSKSLYEDKKEMFPASMQYVTHVYKCDKYGNENKDHFYYKKEYNNLVLARRGHKEVVTLLEKGRMNFKMQAS